MLNLIQILGPRGRKEDINDEGKAAKHEAIIFLFVRRCVRGIFVGGFCTGYLFSSRFYIHLPACVNVIFYALWEKED